MGVSLRIPRIIPLADEILPARAPPLNFDERLERLIADVQGAPPLDPEHPVQLPGEAEQRRARERIETGIPIYRETVDRLRELSEELSVSFSLKLVAAETD